VRRLGEAFFRMEIKVGAEKNIGGAIIAGFPS